MAIVSGDRDIRELNLADSAPDGTNVKYGLIPGRPRYFVTLLEPVSIAAIDSNTPYPSMTRIVNMPYQVILGGYTVQRGFIRNVKDVIMLTSNVMKGATLEIGQNSIYDQLNFNNFGLEIWKPSNQAITVGVFGFEYW